MDLLNLNNISFPVYKLAEREPSIEEGISFYEIKSGQEEDFKIKVIDDLSLPGDSLARRRLHIPDSDKYKISKAIFFLGDLIKLTKTTSWFIDSRGKIFNYKKTCYVPLVCKKIKTLHPIENGAGKVIEVEGIQTRFKTIFTPPPSHAYCLLLKVNNGYIFYGTVQDECKTTRRKI